VEQPERDLNADLADDLDGAFERLVLTYQDRLYSFALRITGSAEDAAEIAQDAFVRAHRALRSYKPERVRTLALKAWLYRITLNVVRNRRRGKAFTLVPLDGPEALAADVEDREQDRPEARFERAESAAALGALVAAMPARYRAAVVLRHVEGLGYEEVSVVPGQPVGTVKAHVHRGIQWLREALARQSSEVS